MKLSTVLLTVAAITCGLSAYARAQEPVTSEDIVVTGRQVRELARAFADAISEPPAREDQLARFQNRLCPGVVGLTQRQGQFVVDRIAQRALDVRLEVGAPGCKANVLVLVTQDAASLAAALAEQERYLMVNYGVREHLHTRGSEALEAFINNARPVRWWHVAQTETAEGDVLGRTNPRMRPDGEVIGVEVARVGATESSRLRRPTLQAVRNVVVIVDAALAGGARLDALADYLAMVSLAQLDPDADTSQHPTILNLFADAQSRQMAGMTDWDIAYLRSLYETRANAPNSSMQIRDVARRMGDELAPE